MPASAPATPSAALATPKAGRAIVIATAALAAALPSLLAHNVSPSPTFWNQALAFALWPAFMLAAAPVLRLRGSGALQAALALLLAAVAASWLLGSLPSSLAWSAMATLAAAALLAAGGAGSGWNVPAAAAPGSGSGSVDVFAAFCWGWVVAGGLNAVVGALQVFAPDAVDAAWVAASSFPGRAVGNLRQPNHLSSLLLWGCIALAALLQLRRLRLRWAAALFAALVFTVVLTASRTGLVSVLLLAVWGAADRRLTRPVRGLLLAAPLLYALSWLAMARWAAASAHAFGGTARLAETDISASRFAIWRDTLTLIAQQPWLGVGFGEFNYAWSLTPLPQRPVALFDHSHNLLLQFAVELGLPLALLVCGLLLAALWRAARLAFTQRPTQGADDRASARRAAVVMVLMIGLHSLLEYPLWYSYFLLPAAWAFGFALADNAASTLAEPAPADLAAAPPPRPSVALALAALGLVFGAAFSVLDYQRVALIFIAEDGMAPLEQRIAAGQRSVFFAHHADYAAVTSGVAVSDPAHAFERATHFLLDTRLMVAWAQALAQQGRVDAASHVAERLREFRKPDAAEFFAPCAAASAAAAGAASTPPFQCRHPGRVPGWRELAAR